MLSFQNLSPGEGLRKTFPRAREFFRLYQWYFITMFPNFWKCLTTDDDVEVRDPDFRDLRPLQHYGQLILHPRSTVPSTEDSRVHPVHFPIRAAPADVFCRISGYHGPSCLPLQQTPDHHSSNLLITSPLDQRTFRINYILLQSRQNGGKWPILFYPGLSPPCWRYSSPHPHG